MSENTAKKQVTAKLTGDYATMFEHLLSELQKENTEATSRQLIEKLLDEKTVFTIAEGAEDLKTELENRNKYVFELQTEIEQLQQSLSDAVEKNGKLIQLAESATGFDFTEAETKKLIQIQAVLKDAYGEDITVEDILRLFVVRLMERPSTNWLPSDKTYLQHARKELATVKIS